jgi:hypothetical protein
MLSAIRLKGLANFSKERAEFSSVIRFTASSVVHKDDLEEAPIKAKIGASSIGIV